MDSDIKHVEEGLVSGAGFKILCSFYTMIEIVFITYGASEN
jgi:hypothetical protein